MKSSRHPVPRPGRPHGSVAVTFAVTLPVVLGMMGFAIDLSLLYMRNANMQHMADATAIAAARRLDGTLAGITAAKSDAEDVARSNYYDGIFRTAYEGAPSKFRAGSSWSTATLYFSASPNGPNWTAADDISDAAAAANMMYVKVDTSVLSGLSENPGKVSTTLMRLLGAPNSFTSAPVSYAGATGMQVTPLGICALNVNKYTSRPITPPSPTVSELVEFGFRRGVSYDLLHLSPNTTTPKNFLLNPIDGTDVAVPDPLHYTSTYLKPFFCSGTIAYTNLRHGRVANVKALGSVDLTSWLNSRFGDFSSGDACTPTAAPRDQNITEFLPPNPGWMTTARPAAKQYSSGSSLVTIADLIPVPSNVATGDYGPLWAFQRPYKFQSTTTGAGSNPQRFARSDWPRLYVATSGPQFSSLASYTAPYNTNVSPGAGFPKRRLMNLPLFDCTAAITDKAPVLGIATFLLTSKAIAASAVGPTDASIYAEFAGLVDEPALANNVRRLQ